MKVKFDREKYKSHRYLMHCATQVQFDTFLTYLDELGETWKGSSYTYIKHIWNRYGKDTVFYFNNGDGGVSHYDNAKQNGYIILEFSDFDWTKDFTKSNLKTGDVAKQRNGEVLIFVKELEGFISKADGWCNVDCWDERLSFQNDQRDFDIVAVRRPMHHINVSFDAFEYECGELVYEREEIEEMTLAEVCKLLGKEIKIIK